MDNKSSIQMDQMSKMDLEDLAVLFIEQPGLENEILMFVDDLSDFYDIINSYILPDEIIFDDAEVISNIKTKQALERLSNYLQNDLYYDDIEDYQNDMVSPLQRREEVLSELEVEEQKITETEELIDKQEKKKEEQR